MKPLLVLVHFRSVIHWRMTQILSYPNDVIFVWMEPLVQTLCIPHVILLVRPGIEPFSFPYSSSSMSLLSNNKIRSGVEPSEGNDDDAQWILCCPYCESLFPVDLNSCPGHSPISACSMKAKNRTALTYLILQIILFTLRKEVIAYVIPLLIREYPSRWLFL